MLTDHDRWARWDMMMTKVLTWHPSPRDSFRNLAWTRLALKPDLGLVLCAPAPTYRLGAHRSDRTLSVTTVAIFILRCGSIFHIIQRYGRKDQGYCGFATQNLVIFLSPTQPLEARLRPSADPIAHFVPDHGVFWMDRNGKLSNASELTLVVRRRTFFLILPWRHLRA